jgi:hypothetical protein
VLEKRWQHDSDEKKTLAKTSRVQVNTQNQEPSQCFANQQAFTVNTSPLRSVLQDTEDCNS